MPDLHDQPLDQVPIAVLDFETTGLRVKKGDRVIEVGVLRTEPDHRGMFHERILDTLVDPKRDIPERVVGIHGITTQMVQGAPVFADISGDLRSILEGAVVVAHNAPFDLAFLSKEARLAGVEPIEVAASLDTLPIARHIFGFYRCSLIALAERMGIAHRRAHTALGDAQTTLMVLRRMIDALAEDGVAPTVREVTDLTESLRRGGLGRQQILDEIRVAAEEHRDLVIDYTDVRGEGAISNRRRITIQNLRLPYIDAYCHLREAERVFKVDRIRQIHAMAS